MSESDTRSPPASMAELSMRIIGNQRATGYGIDTTLHMPCGFCGAADWMVFRVIETQTAMARGARCKACGRSMRADFHPAPAGGMSFELVQTGGDDAPAWLTPAPRRAVR